MRGEPLGARSLRGAAKAMRDRAGLTLPAGRFVYRRCRVCEWEGEVAQSSHIDPGCPMCHAPTEVLALLHPTPEPDSPNKNPHAAALGRLGGLRGGPARAAKLSSKRRRLIARKAALARWNPR